MRNNMSQEDLRREEIFHQKIQEVSQKKGRVQKSYWKDNGEAIRGVAFFETHPPGGEAGALLDSALFPGQAMDKLKPGRCCC